MLVEFLFQQGQKNCIHRQNPSPLQIASKDRIGFRFLWLKAPLPLLFHLDLMSNLPVQSKVCYDCRFKISKKKTRNIKLNYHTFHFILETSYNQNLNLRNHPFEGQTEMFESFLLESILYTIFDVSLLQVSSVKCIFQKFDKSVLEQLKLVLKVSPVQLMKTN